MMRLRSFLAIAALVATSCGSSGPAPKQGHMAYTPPAVAGNSSSNVRAEEYRFDADEIDGSTTGGQTGMSKAKPKSSQEIDQLFVKNAWLTLEVSDEDDFAPTITVLRDTAKKLGGYVADESRQHITIKVPAGRLEEAKAAAVVMGEITKENVSVVDVTANYVDLKIRIENLQKLKKRLGELVEEGENVKEILEVEKELSRVTGELERLEGQMRLMSNQIAYATISITLEEKVSPGPIGWVFYGVYTGVKWLFVWD